MVIAIHKIWKEEEEEEEEHQKGNKKKNVDVYLWNFRIFPGAFP